MTAILSPCVKICALDEASGLCAGCGRTLTEIGCWLGYSDEERREVMADLPARLARMRNSARPAAEASP